MLKYVMNACTHVPPVHPGDILRDEVLPALGISADEAARRLQISQTELNCILVCVQPISIEMAVKIGTLSGEGPYFWLRLQRDYDRWHEEKADERTASEDVPVACEC